VPITRTHCVIRGVSTLLLFVGCVRGAALQAQHRSQIIPSPFGAEGANTALRSQVYARRDLPPRYHELGLSYVQLHFPFPVHDAEVERWTRMLSLSEPQAAVVAGFMKWYRDEFAKLGESAIRPLWEQSSDLADCPRSHPAAECARRAEALAQAQRRVTAAIVALDDALFARINEVLAPAQVDSMRRVQAFRKAERARYIRHFHDSAAIDLSATIDYLFVQGALDIAEPNAFFEALWEYEQMFASLLVEYHRKYLEAAGTGRRVVAAQEAQVDPTSAMSRYTSRWRTLRHAELRLVELNRTYLEVLSAQLGETSAELLNRWFREGSYPQLYLGRGDATTLRDVALTLAAADVSKRTQIAALAVEFEAQRDLIEKRVTTLCDEFAYASIGVHPQNVKPKFDADLAAEMRELKELEEQFAASLRELFNPVPTELEAQILKSLGGQPVPVKAQGS